MNARSAGRLACAVAFVAAGTLHFAKPRMYEAIVPRGLGDPALLVAISGAAEIAGGLGLLIAATRGAAGYGLVALLIAVWPANWEMALHAERYASIAPAWALWLRVPVQLPLIAAVLAVRR